MTRRLHILKFGSSVLATPSDAVSVVEEIYRWIRRGQRVIAVVSAVGDTTDRLREEASAIDPHATDRAVARWLALGERESAARLELELERWGIAATTRDPESLGLRTVGPPLDASPIAVDVRAIDAAWGDASVLVVPGFFGIDTHGETTLLGRGGTDLTALFLGHTLDAPVRLLKDTAGIYESDPNAPDAHPDRFATITWEDALSLGGEVVQPKAIEFARQHDLEFDVARTGDEETTRVGRSATRAVAAPIPAPTVSVSVIGHGTVGREAIRRIRNRREFTLSGVAVRDLSRHIFPIRESWTDDVYAVLAGKSDIVLELTGAPEASEWIEAALRSGKSVVTAHKEAIARDGAHLHAIAEESGATLHYSATVGGALPAIETVRRLASDNVEGGAIRTIEGILNGTSNFVLGAVAKGSTLAMAVARAEELGFAEADSTLDLSGEDAAFKMTILARVAGVHVPSRPYLEPLTRALCESLTDPQIETPVEVATSSVDVESKRQIVSLAVDGDDSAIEVRIRTPEVATFSRASGAENRLMVTLRDGRTETWAGRGAGARPTALAVLSDLEDASRALRARSLVSTAKGVRDSNH